MTFRADPGTPSLSTLENAMRYPSLLLALFALGCAPSTDCDLTATAADLAGSGATACGSDDADADEAGWACALSAWSAGTPFILRYASTGIDSVISRAWVSDGSRVWILSQDSFDSNPDIDGNECVDPVMESDPDAGYDVLGCGSTEPEGNHYQVCGELCTDCGDPDPLPFDP